MSLLSFCYWFMIWFHCSQTKHYNFNSYQDLDDKNVKSFFFFSINIQISEALYFLFIFSLFVLGNFYSFFSLHFLLSLFIDFFWRRVATIFEDVYFLFISSLYPFLCWDFFYFVSNMFLITWWCIFMIVAIKPFSEKPSLSFSSMLASINCFFHSVWGLCGASFICWVIFN